MDPTAIMDPPLSTSSSSSMRTLLEMCLTIQAAHGQFFFLDLLNEVVALQVDLANARGAFPPAPPSDQS